LDYKVFTIFLKICCNFCDFLKKLIFSTSEVPFAPSFLCTSKKGILIIHFFFVKLQNCDSLFYLFWQWSVQNLKYKLYAILKQWSIMLQKWCLSSSKWVRGWQQIEHWSSAVKNWNSILKILYISQMVQYHRKPGPLSCGCTGTMYHVPW
jgi:hypothetical protein